MRLTIPGHLPCHTTHCAEIALELATRGARATEGRGHNLPLDPRPTLTAVQDSLLKTLNKTFIVAKADHNPAPYGYGPAFHNDEWFDTVPNYQHPGTSPLAPQVPRRDPPKAQQKYPTRGRTGLYDRSAPKEANRTWPQTSIYMAQNICAGTPACRYPSNPNYPEKCNSAWQRHSEALLQAFINANPDISIRSVKLHCVERIDDRHRCYTKVHSTTSGHPTQNAQLARFPNGEKFIIAQPDCPETPCSECINTHAQWRETLPQLEIKDSGTQRSWLHPGKTSLLIIGNADTIAKVDTKYRIPTKTAPTRCVLYHQTPPSVRPTPCSQ